MGNSSAGPFRAEQSGAPPSNTSWVRAADLIQTSGTRIEAARNAGFTTAVTFLLGGVFTEQGAVVNLAGEKPGDMVVASPAGLKADLGVGLRAMEPAPQSLAELGLSGEIISYPQQRRDVWVYDNRR